MPPRTTRWAIEPHTVVKHTIVQRYLYAWLPIMARTNERILYIDGFAGPGRYSNGEEGSPLIAIKAVLNHPSFREPKRRGEVEFLFIEAMQDRTDALIEELNQLKAGTPFPPWLKYEVIHGEFGREMSLILDRLQQTGQQLPPTFAFIDPFGYKDVPMALIS